MSNHRDPKWHLHSRLISKLDLLLTSAGAHGIAFTVTSGARGFEKQALMDRTYARSPQEAREKYGVVADPAPMGMSRHHPWLEGKALAVDIAVLDEVPEVKKAKQRQLGELGEAIGLFWGGRFKTPDLVHFELMQEGHRWDIDAEIVKIGALIDAALGFVG